MAGGGFMDGIFEVYTHVHVDQTINEVHVPVTNIPTGCYIVVVVPLVTRQDGIDEQRYTFKAGEFVVYSDDQRHIAAGQSALFNKSGLSDYWGINVAYTDSTTKNELTIKCGGGAVYFPGDHDLYILRVKGD